MHVLYVHQNFPAQFGHIAGHLVREKGYRCTFVSATPAGRAGGIEKVEYRPAGGATRSTHFCSRTFENAVWHTDGVYRALAARPDIRPDLIVGHSGFGSTLFLRELYPAVPVLNLFEYYYRPRHPESDMDFRTDLGWPVSAEKYQRSLCRNAMILLDLQHCDAGYTPTGFQRSCFPAEYQPKLRTIFDGVDRSIYHAHDNALRPAVGQRPPRTVAGVRLPAGARVATYVSRGFESMRGFDIFLKAADLACREMSDAHVVVVGTDQISYGGDEQHMGGAKSFKEWVIATNDLDLSRVHFVGRLPPAELGRVLAASDAHVYLTVPFVLSWSMMDAMSCGAVVVASDTAPVREMIASGVNGILCDFFDPGAFARAVVAALRDPAAHRPLGDAAAAGVEQRYSLDAVLPDMLALYERVASAGHHR